MSAWLHVIGVGPEMQDSITPGAMSALTRADKIICQSRYHDLAAIYCQDVVVWNREFRTVIEEISRYRDCGNIVLLVTGDPLWFSAGSSISKAFNHDEVCFHPQVSSFQLACARMHWNVDETVLLSILGTRRPPERIVPCLAAGTHIVALSPGGDHHKSVARMLINHGYSDSIVTVLANMGYGNETRFQCRANEWIDDTDDTEIPEFHVICIDCRADTPAIPATRAPGLPDSLYGTSGNFTKSEVRALTVCALLPGRGKVMWDLGTGTGSVAIEWMRSAETGKAFALDITPSRIECAVKNAYRLGVPEIVFMTGDACSLLASIDKDPDSVFIGGGLSRELVDAVLARLKTPGRLVVNSVTIESEALLYELHGTFGGELTRISIGKSRSIERFRGWGQFMPVTQWRYDR